MKKTAYSLFFLMFLFTGCFRIKDSISQIPTNTTSFNAIYFSGDSGTNKKVNAYLVKEINYGGKTLRIWLDYLKYNETNKAEAIKLGQQFLNGNNTNDIYHLLTNVFGAEWGSHSFNYLIQPKNKIDILLTTINSNYAGGSYVMGYFNPEDTFYNGTQFYDSNDKKWKTLTTSNENNMFYIDINLLTGNYTTSSDKSEMKKDIYSTLAHEFVHMITWYQKDISLLNLQNKTETWLNEMLAMMGEDLVDDKITVDGISGVDGSKMRIPSFKQNNNIDINDKDGSYDNVDYNIGAVYGLYLSRAYGYKSLNFYKEIVQNTKVGTDAIDYAVNKVESEKYFLGTLKDFGKALMLSDINKGSSSLAGKDYLYYINRNISDLNIGSYNYKFEPINIFSGNEKFYFLATQSEFKGGANTYLKLRDSSESNGSKEWTITLPNNEGTYKISGNMFNGESVYLVFNSTDITQSNAYSKIVATGITSSLLTQNLVGPEISKDTKIDVNSRFRDRLVELGLITIPKQNTNKAIADVNGEIRFQIIVKDANGFNSERTEILENSVTKIN